MDVNNAGLRAAGDATVAGIPSKLAIDLDFGAGPPTQIQQKVTVSGTLDSARLASLGIDAPGLFSGGIGLTATLALRRNGEGQADISADLATAGLRLAPLGFSKPAGQPASLTATVALLGDKVTAITPIQARGAGISVDASATFADGKPDLVTLRRAVLGTTTDVHGTARAPRAPGEPWRLDLSGASLDMSGAFARQTASAPATTTPPKPPAAGPPYIADARLDRLLLGKRRPIASVVLHVEDDGLVTRRASLAGRTLATGGGGKGGGGPFTLTITPVGTPAGTPEGRKRQLYGDTPDAGGLLLALDIDDKVEGGRMTITGDYDDTRPEHPLVGTAIVEDFRVHDAPLLGRLLQAMTLYGVAEVARGPGLGFSRLEAPFRYGGDALELTDARAFSASLGMTAKGRIDLARSAADIQGTIVPAYFFNSLLGDIPLVGKLFSPERGGGLFAATYTVSGPLDDPKVSVNPLAALTPGFLRGVFKLFDTSNSGGATTTTRTGRPPR
jgi:hypothetical protein